MKRTLLFVLALIAVGCSEPIPRNLDDLSRQGPQYLDPETLEPYSGPAYRMSEDDSTQIVLRVNLRDGRFHGDFEDFELEGDSLGLYQTGTYRDGQRERRSEHFYPSGALYDRVSFENDRFPYDSFRREGRSEHFYPSGALYDRVSYENDELDGPAEYYHENGQLWEKSTYTAGERDGPLEGYHENGQLEIRTTYAAGELDGPFERYDENGQLVSRGVWNMGEMCGGWISEGEALTLPPC